MASVGVRAERAVADGARIWFVDLDRDGATLLDLGDIHALLPADDRERLSRLDDDGARRQRTAAHVALRLALAGHISMEQARAPFVRDAGGRPSLACGTCRFSLAHIDGAALIAISTASAVGIDIERVRPVSIGAERLAMYSSAAVAFGDGRPLAGHDDEARFMAAWTRVEAIAKATGLGIAGLIGALDLRRAAPEQLVPGRMDDVLGRGVDRLVAHDLDLPGGLVGAVALPRQCRVPGVACTDAARLTAIAGVSDAPPA